MFLSETPLSRPRAVAGGLRTLGLTALLGGVLLAVAGCGNNALQGGYNNLPPPKNGGGPPGSAATMPAAAPPSAPKPAASHTPGQ